MCTTAPVGTISADFSGETVVVTGGSSGIGRAVATGFGAAGQPDYEGTFVSSTNHSQHFPSEARKIAGRDPRERTE